MELDHPNISKYWFSKFDWEVFYRDSSLLNILVSTTALLGLRTHPQTPVAQFRVRRQTDDRTSNYRKNEEILR